MAYCYHAKNFKNLKKGLQDTTKTMKLDFLTLAHLQTGVFRILIYGSFGRPQLLLKPCLKKI